MPANGTGQTGKSVAIIGGGIAGLCAGCYAQMNGYQSRIYEMHDLPGGLMTAWERKGYTIDYCIQWLVGSSPTSSSHKLWREVGLLRDRQIVDLDIWAEYEDADGRRVTFWRDLDRLEAHLCALSPADADFIKRVLKDARRLASVDMPADLPPRELMGLRDTLRVGPSMLPWVLPGRRWGKLTWAISPPASSPRSCATPSCRSCPRRWAPWRCSSPWPGCTPATPATRWAARCRSPATWSDATWSSAARSATTPASRGS